MNIDINRDVAVGFDRDGNPLNYIGEEIPSGKGKRLLMSKELLDSLRRARKEIDREE